MLLAFYDDGGWQDLAIVAGIAVVAYLLVMWVAALVWTYRDVVSRTRDTTTQTISLVLVLIFGLPGLLIYLVLRPKDTLADQYDRQLEAEALLHELQEQATCPKCRRKVETDFFSCPFCRAELRIPCESCGKAMIPTWVMCAYCGTDRRDIAPPAIPARAGTTEPSMAARATGAAPATPSSVPEAPMASERRLKRASTATYTPPAAATAPTPATDPTADTTL